MTANGETSKKKSTPRKSGGAAPRTSETVADLGKAAKEVHERGKADRAAMRETAKDLGADIMEDMKDFGEKAADAAVKATAAAADFGTKAASAVSPTAGSVVEAAGKVATKTTEAAGKVAGQAADAAVEAAGKAADVAQDIADKAEDAAESSAEELLKRAQDTAEEWQGKYMRLHAEWDNYRRRTTEQREEEKARATENLVGDLLPVLDDFERSITYAVENGSENLLDGVKAVHTKLVDTLQKSGVEVIDPKGQAFDSLEAQAVATVDDESVPDETVNDVYQKGYKMGKKVIRPATVTVTSGGPKRPKEEDEQDGKK